MAAPARIGRARTPELEDRGISDPSSSTTAPPDQKNWRSLSHVLKRFFGWLNYTQQMAPGEQLDIWSIKPGDTVELSVAHRHATQAEILSRVKVTAANRRHYKLEDWPGIRPAVRRASIQRAQV